MFGLLPHWSTAWLRALQTTERPTNRSVSLRSSATSCDGHNVLEGSEGQGGGGQKWREGSQQGGLACLLVGSSPVPLVCAE